MVDNFLLTVASHDLILTQNVWVLSTDGQILSRLGITKENPSGSSWKRVMHPDNVSVTDFTLACRQSGWLIDQYSRIYFSDNYDSDPVNWWQVSKTYNFTKSVASLVRDVKELFPLETLFSTLLLGHSRSSTPFQDVFSISVAPSLGALLQLSNITPGGSEARVVGRNTRQEQDNKKTIKTILSAVLSHLRIFYQ